MKTLLLIVHLLWVLWMVSGVLVAALGFRYPRLWRLRLFRTAHLVAILATATVPIWNEGVCPITEWESAAAGDPAGRPFLTRLVSWFVYWDVSPIFLAALTGAAALFSVVVYFRHPPRRAKE